MPGPVRLTADPSWPPSYTAAAPALVFTALRLSGFRGHRTAAPLSFTHYAAPISAALAIRALRRREPRSAAVLAACSAALTALVLPRTRAKPQPAGATGPVLRIMAANVLLGRADAEALVELVREHQPDVLAIQEQRPSFMAKLEAAGLYELLPHRVMASGRRRADAGVLSRHPLTAIGPDLPSFFTAACVELPGGRAVPVISVHPLPPVGPEREHTWVRALRNLPAPGGKYAGGLVAGDFNATLDHAEFRAVLDTGWRDASNEAGAGLRPTWSGRLVLSLTIDHVLVPPGAAVLAYRVDRLKGSDHRAVTVDVALPAED